jgi:hypothetical protein
MDLSKRRLLIIVFFAVQVTSALLARKSAAEVFDWEDAKTGYMFAIKTSGDPSVIVIGTVGIAELPPDLQTGIYYVNQRFRALFEQYSYTPGTPYPEIQQKEYRISPLLWTIGTVITVNTSSNGVLATYSAEGRLRLASGSENFPPEEEASGKSKFISGSESLPAEGV